MMADFLSELSFYILNYHYIIVFIVPYHFSIFYHFWVNEPFNLSSTIIMTKNCWVVLTQLWVKYGQTQPLGYIFNDIFNPTFGFVQHF